MGWLKRVSLLVVVMMGVLFVFILGTQTPRQGRGPRAEAPKADPAGDQPTDPMDIFEPAPDSAATDSLVADAAVP